MTDESEIPPPETPTGEALEAIEQAAAAKNLERLEEIASRTAEAADDYTLAQAENMWRDHKSPACPPSFDHLPDNEKGIWLHTAARGKLQGY